MDTLLKDKPEFKERIENNVHLRQDVTEIITEIGTTHEQKADQIIDLFTSFINQNYK